MILVCGTIADSMVELMCARLADLEYDYVLLDQVHYPGRFQISWEVGAGGVKGYIASPTRRVDLDDLTGVYARYVSTRGGPAPPGLSKIEREMVDAEYQFSLMQLLDLL